MNPYQQFCSEMRDRGYKCIRTESSRQFDLYWWDTPLVTIAQVWAEGAFEVYRQSPPGRSTAMDAVEWASDEPVKKVEVGG